MFHSQYKQDMFLEKNVFKGYKNGFFIDVGAHDGVTINNTLYFQQNNNWSGINIEPIKSVYNKLVINRPNDINLNCAVSNNDGTAEFILNIGYPEMLSGLKDNYDKRHSERLEREKNNNGGETTIITINTKKIETICDTYNIKHINYLTVDVEGAEFEVIKSINFDKVFIDVIDFENNYDDNSEPIIRYLEEKNYKVIQKESDIMMINKNSIFIKNTN
jgi:FkbM family methyltransferase